LPPALALRIGIVTVDSRFLQRAQIVISKLLKRHSKEKRKAPAYSRELRQIIGIVQRIVHQRVTEGRSEVAGTAYAQALERVARCSLYYDLSRQFLIYKPALVARKFPTVLAPG